MDEIRDKLVPLWLTKFTWFKLLVLPRRPCGFRGAVYYVPLKLGMHYLSIWAPRAPIL